MSTSPYILSPPATPQSQMMAYEASIATGDGYGSGGTPDNPFFHSAQSSMTHLPPTAHSPIKCKVKYEGDLLPPIGLAPAPYVMPKKVDMGFPGKGTEAAKAGIQTPLAQYTSQMVSWLWFGRYTPARYYPDGTPIVSDPFEYSLHNPLHPRQVAPTIEFERFVDRLLHITQVSHSVVLVSLLYIYRLKNRYHIEAGAGTEMRAFVAGLILANKYLDDNTYTTKTWAELTGLPLREVCQMEVEFLRGLQYRLCVSKTDYTTWRHLLDGFILSRSTGGVYRSRFNPTFHHSGFGSPTNPLITPATSYIPSHPYTSYTDVRARSFSPQTAATYSPSSRCYTPRYDYGNGNSTCTGTGSTYGYGRKRSAVDAFAGEYTPQSTVYGRPPRRAHARAHAEPASTSGTSSIGLVRSSSCNRQIARLPGSASGGVGRRGSAGNMRAGLYGQESDLRHTAANHAAYLTYEQSKGKESVPDAGEGWWTTLVAPCDQYPEAHAIPPEQMTFYTVAATPHMGQDGAPRKAILRHQDPHPYSYPPQYQPYIDPKPSVQGWRHVDEYADDSISPTAAYVPDMPTSTSYLTPSYEGYYPSDQVYSAGQTTVESEPAQFANAGPPGYAYDPTAIYSAGPGYEGTGGLQGTNRWSTTSEGMALAHAHAYGHTGSASEQWRTRSEWSSPMPGYDGWMRA